MTAIEEIKDEFVKAMSDGSYPEPERLDKLKLVSTSTRSFLCSNCSPLRREKFKILGTKDEYKQIGEILEEIHGSYVIPHFLADYQDLYKINRDHDLWWTLTCIYAPFLWPRPVNIQKNRHAPEHWNLSLESGVFKGVLRFHHLRTPMLYYSKFRASDAVMDGKWWRSYAAHLFAVDPGSLGGIWQMISRSAILNSTDAVRLHEIAKEYYFDNASNNIRRNYGHSPAVRHFVRAVHELRNSYAIEHLPVDEARELLHPILEIKSPELFKHDRETDAIREDAELDEVLDALGDLVSRRNLAKASLGDLMEEARARRLRESASRYGEEDVKD